MKIKDNIVEIIKKGDSYFESNYFNEALFEYESAINLTEKVDSNDLTSEIKEHIVNVFEKKAYCFDELNLHNEAIETYLRVINFLENNFEKKYKDNFLNKNYSNISGNILEAFIEAEVFEKNFNYREAFDRREKALKLVDKFTIHIGDLLSFKSPYELLKQADLAKLLTDYPRAKRYYNIALNIANDYGATSTEFFKPYTEIVFNKSINFYEEMDDSAKVVDLLDKLILFIEGNFSKGEGINFVLAGDSYVKKALLNTDINEKHKFFNKAMEFYSYIDTRDIKNPFYYYIAYVETKLYVMIEPQELMDTLEELTEFFLQKSTKNYGTYYYLKTLKILLLVYFDKKQLLNIFEIERNLHINRDILNSEELSIYLGIDKFLKGCRALLNFQKAIYINHQTQNENAMIAHSHFKHLWDTSFISNEEYASFLYTLTKLYRDTIKDDAQAIFYLEMIPPLYNEELCSESSNIIFASSFYELSLYYQELAGFQDSLAYISKAIQLFKELFSANPIAYATKLHNALMNRAVMSYNYFNDYDSFEHSIKESIEVLEANIQTSVELTKLLKALSLKASIDYHVGKTQLALDSYEKAYNIYEFYSFKNSGNLDRIYGGIIDKGIDLAVELGNKEVEGKFIKSKENIKLFNI